jgi:hypothetical protein
MSLASVTVAFIAALARPRVAAQPDSRVARLERENGRLRSDNARLGQIANDLQSRLAEAQSRHDVQEVHSPFEGMPPDERRREATWILERQALRDFMTAQQNPSQTQSVGQLGAQNLALDAEFWRNCSPSRADGLTAHRRDDEDRA